MGEGRRREGGGRKEGRERERERGREREIVVDSCAVGS